MKNIFRLDPMAWPELDTPCNFPPKQAEKGASTNDSVADLETKCSLKTPSGTEAFQLLQLLRQRHDLHDGIGNKEATRLASQRFSTNCCRRTDMQITQVATM